MPETKSTRKIAKVKRAKITVRIDHSDLKFIHRAVAIDFSSINKFAIKAMMRFASDTIRAEQERNGGK